MNCTGWSYAVFQSFYCISERAVLALLHTIVALLQCLGVHNNLSQYLANHMPTTEISLKKRFASSRKGSGCQVCCLSEVLWFVSQWRSYNQKLALSTTLWAYIGPNIPSCNNSTMQWAITSWSLFVWKVKNVCFILETATATIVTLVHWWPFFPILVYQSCLNNGDTGMYPLVIWVTRHEFT